LSLVETCTVSSVVDKAIVKENRYAIRAQVSAWIASDDVQVVLITGGTGLTEGDQAPEALLPLFDREVEGFGEVFRMLSFEEIGTSTLQSRAVAGVANKTLIFAMPGSTKACRTAWENIIAPQLDARTRPCHFIHSSLFLPVLERQAQSAMRLVRAVAGERHGNPRILLLQRGGFHRG